MTHWEPLIYPKWTLLTSRFIYINNKTLSEPKEAFIGTFKSFKKKYTTVLQIPSKGQWEPAE